MSNLRTSQEALELQVRDLSQGYPNGEPLQLPGACVSLRFASQLSILSHVQGFQGTNVVASVLEISNGKVRNEGL